MVILAAVIFVESALNDPMNAGFVSGATDFVVTRSIPFIRNERKVLFSKVPRIFRARV